MTARVMPLPAFAAMSLLLLVSAILAVTGGRFIVAGLAAYQAESFMSAWSANGRQPQAVAWGVAAEAAERARQWYPVANGDYLDRLGRVNVWKHVEAPIVLPDDAVMSSGGGDVRQSRVAALAAFRTAAGLRPQWALGQVRVAQAKLSLLELDDEFLSAIRSAHRLAPYQRDISLELGKVGLLAWPSLSGGDRELVRSALRVALAPADQRSTDFLEEAIALGMASEVCQLPAAAGMRQQCESAGAPAWRK